MDHQASSSRLSAHMEPTEVKPLASSKMSGSIEALSRAMEKMSVESFPFSEEEDALNFTTAKLGQLYLPWYLRPNYTSETLKVDAHGRVRAGTLSALVERLTDPNGVLLLHQYSCCVKLNCMQLGLRRMNSKTYF